jgi:hypothetical protein
MSEEATQVVGSQEVAEPVAATGTQATQAAPSSFLDMLPEDLRQEPSLRSFTNPADLAKSYVHAQRMIGADKVALPGKSATDDEWRAIYTKLGAPDDPQKYEFTEPPKVLDDGAIGEFRNAAFEAGLNNRQADTVAKFMDTTLHQAQAKFEQQAEELRYSGEQELRKEWGQAFDQRVELAYKAALDTLGSADILDEVKLADGRMLGDHPAIVRMFAKIAEQIGEDNLVGETTEMVMTPNEASQRISEMTRRDSPYWDKMHPEHDKYVQEVLRLREYA